jgi:protein kinase-like protein
MSIALSTASQQRILVNDVPLASGGEGAVHRVLSSQSYNNHCVKLYIPQHRTKLREDKISFMVKNPPPSLHGSTGGKYVICWPSELVFENHKFAGFVMPLAFDGSIQLYELCTPTLKPIIAGAWHTKYDRASTKGVQSRLKLCVNIASAINTVHGMGSYVLVDFKPQNILVTDDGRVSLIDLDSIQIANNNRVVFPAQVATPEYVPPEGNHLNPARDVISESWDRFSLAIVLYELLFGLHPYAASYQGRYQNYNTIADSIKSGLFVFGSKRRYVYCRPPLHDNFQRIPNSLQRLFLDALDAGSTNPNARPKAEEWGRTIFGELNTPVQPFKIFPAAATKRRMAPHRARPAAAAVPVPPVPAPAGLPANLITANLAPTPAPNKKMHFGNRAAVIMIVILAVIGLVCFVSYLSQQGRISVAGGTGPLTPRQLVDMSVVRAAVKSTLEGWVTATKTGNVENCMSFFADRLDTYYSLKNVSSDKVRSDLIKAFSNYSTFDVQLSNVEIAADQSGTTATATFDKTFNFQGQKYYSGTVQQRLWFANLGGRWRIIGIRELRVYAKNSGVVTDASEETADSTSGPRPQTAQPRQNESDEQEARKRRDALAQSYLERVDLLVRRNQLKVALAVCNEGLAVVSDNDGLLRKRSEIERALTEGTSNGSGEASSRQPAVSAGPSLNTPIPTPAPRMPAPVYQGPKQGVITRSVAIESNDFVSLGDDLPGVPVIIAVEPKEQFGVVESPGPSNRWKRLVLRSNKKTHVVITVRWSVL